MYQNFAADCIYASLERLFIFLRSTTQSRLSLSFDILMLICTFLFFLKTHSPDILAVARNA
ncbi:hypothetical protein A359_03780 [secondary endosymbiont of Ctenarytaina eucalypti]|uniref:Uncharacterized protein n=1 Tax=secondary endosymbiont of Ctenarytaina eucalypti TaxID=1199245 RepID=J3TF79_9ENTR|nr:hypothetical protein A359_03780 [secondary endosymbiont of Ctenarytaina eucalypti]